MEKRKKPLDSMSGNVVFSVSVDRIFLCDGTKGCAGDNLSRRSH